MRFIIAVDRRVTYVTDQVKIYNNMIETNNNRNVNN